MKPKQTATPKNQPPPAFDASKRGRYIRNWLDAGFEAIGAYRVASTIDHLGKEATDGVKFSGDPRK